jgi:hypothetical protein
MKELKDQIIMFAVGYQELVAVGVGIVVFLLMWWWIVRDREPKIRCRWRRDRSGQRATLTKWTCARCGADAFTTNRKPPQSCKRNLKPNAL